MTTLDDVAKKAKVSSMTVSRILNNSQSVKPETKARVEKVIAELNYRPNMIAKSLVRGSSNTIGVLYSNVYNQAYLDMIMGIDEVAYQNDFTIMSTNVDNYNSAVKAFEMLMSNQIQGLIVMPMEMSMSTREDFYVSIDEMARFYHYLMKELSFAQIPAITISQKCDDISNISFDFPRLAEIALNYLLSIGKKDITMINSNIQDGLWQEKEEVYKKIMTDNNLTEYLRIVREPATVQGGHIAMQHIAESKNIPQAVFCANDYIAIGAIQSAWSNGLKVPSDISIMGNDDIKFCEMTFPKITTVALNSFKAGQTAMNQLIKKIAGENIEDTIIEPTLVVRKSVLV